MASRSSFKLPDTFVIVFSLALLVAILTYILPAGVYEMVKDAASGRMMVDPTSYKEVARTPVSVMQFLMSIPVGMRQSVVMSSMVLIMGGAFQVIYKTGAVDNLISAGIKTFKDRALLILPILSVMFFFMGSFSVLTNAVLALIPVALVLTRRLHVDPPVAICTFYVSVFGGFGASPFNPTTVLVAQDIAGLEPFSGLWLRTAIWFVFMSTTAWYCYYRAAQVRDNPAASLVPELMDFSDEESLKIEPLTLRQSLTLLTFVGAMGIFIYQALGQAKWGAEHLSALFVGVTVLAGLIGGMTPDQTAKNFVDGAKNVLYGAIMMGLARSIAILMTEGQIIHTIIHYLTQGLAFGGTVFAAVGMFVANAIFNIFVPSGSGQAVIVMPLMAPMADILGFSRQISVSAFQYGDSVTNILIPTSGILMASLGICNLPFGKWFRWIFPLFALWCVIAAMSVAGMTLAGWQ